MIEKGESCDPFLDGCEAGTICFPTTFDLSENVCAEFDAEKYFEETKSIKSLFVFCVCTFKFYF